MTARGLDPGLAALYPFLADAPGDGARLESDALGRRGDLAIGFSTSGNSENVVLGLTKAARLGLTTVGFAGYAGGAMAMCNAIAHLFVVPSSSVHRIQEAQTTLCHVLWAEVRGALEDRSER